MYDKAAIAQLQNAEMLLQETEQNAQNDARHGAQKSNHPTFAKENLLDVLLRGAQAAQYFSVFFLFQNQHRQRTDNVEKCDKQDKTKHQVGDPFFHAVDAIKIGLLFVSILH